MHSLTAPPVVVLVSPVVSLAVVEPVLVESDPVEPAEPVEPVEPVALPLLESPLVDDVELVEEDAVSLSEALLAVALVAEVLTSKPTMQPPPRPRPRPRRESIASEEMSPAGRGQVGMA